MKWRTIKSVDYIVIHCAATRPDMGISLCLCVAPATEGDSDDSEDEDEF